jgi:hypothetical protein
MMLMENLQSKWKVKLIIGIFRRHDFYVDDKSIFNNKFHQKCAWITVINSKISLNCEQVKSVYGSLFNINLLNAYKMSCFKPYIQHKY